LPFIHKSARQLVEKERVARGSLMYGSEGLGAERNIETPTQKLASFISPKPSEMNPVSPSGDYSDEVSDRSFEITLWLTVSGITKLSELPLPANEHIAGRQSPIPRFTGHDPDPGNWCKRPSAR
jgi:hypothetical protein